MKIFTSYFANGKRLKAAKLVQFGICLYPPTWFKGMNITSVAPTHSILYDKYRTDERYTQRYEMEVLSKLDARKFVEELQAMSGGRDVVLCCYEKPKDFCPHHILARWITENTGIAVKEFGDSSVEQSLF